MVWQHRMSGAKNPFLDGRRRTTREAEQILEKMSGPPLTLPKVNHQQAHESGQARPRLANWHTHGQRPAGGLATVRTAEAMLTILGHFRLDFRQFPDLMP